MGTSRHREAPHVVDTVAGHVTRLFVFLPEIERLALVGPLLLAIAARDERPVACGLGIGGREKRRPEVSALPGAGRLAGRIAIVGVERHALVIDPDLALGGRPDG